MYTPWGYMETWKDWALFGGVVAFILIFIGTATLAFLQEHYCAETSEIVSVGGCNRDGYCGVKLANGSFKTERLPVIGEHLCVAREWKWRFE